MDTYGGETGEDVGGPFAAAHDTPHTTLPKTAFLPGGEGDGGEVEEQRRHYITAPAPCSGGRERVRAGVGGAGGGISVVDGLLRRGRHAGRTLLLAPSSACFTTARPGGDSGEQRQDTRDRQGDGDGDDDARQTQLVLAPAPAPTPSQPEPSFSSSARSQRETCPPSIALASPFFPSSRYRYRFLVVVVLVVRVTRRPGTSWEIRSRAAPSTGPLNHPISMLDHTYLHRNNHRPWLAMFANLKGVDCGFTFISRLVTEIAPANGQAKARR